MQSVIDGLGKRSLSFFCLKKKKAEKANASQKKKGSVTPVIRGQPFSSSFVHCEVKKMEGEKAWKLCSTE
jgi:hypothetical protein